VPTILSLIIFGAVTAFLAANTLLAGADPQQVIRFFSKYGYFAILFAAFWEGEAVLIAAGVLCGSGYLDWRLTIIAAAIGGSAGDQIYFYAAHDRAARLINKSKRLRKWYPRISKFVLKHSTIAVLLSRFAAGLRITIPLVCATAGMPAKKYSILNLISAFAWASFWVGVMYQVGARVHPV
jgi:membrane protein DedA with SNARE-associated domain